MSKIPAPVSVITPTRNGNGQLMRCAESVANQDYSGRIEHIIIGDDSPELKRLKPDLEARFPHSLVRNLRLEELGSTALVPFHVPSRLGLLRNIGIQMARGAYICHLDDEHVIDRKHLSTLVETIESELSIDAAYSWRKMVWPNGSPYLVEEYPWTPMVRHVLDHQALARHIYNNLADLEVWTRGSNIVKDTMFAAEGEPLFTVDASELLVRAEVHDLVAFSVSYPWRRIVGDYADGHDFVERASRIGCRFKCSKQATLNYTVGGYSSGPGFKGSWPA